MSSVIRFYTYLQTYTAHLLGVHLRYTFMCSSNAIPHHQSDLQPTTLPIFANTTVLSSKFNFFYPDFPFYLHTFPLISNPLAKKPRTEKPPPILPPPSVVLLPFPSFPTRSRSLLPLHLPRGSLLAITIYPEPCVPATSSHPPPSLSSLPVAPPSPLPTTAPSESRSTVYGNVAMRCGCMPTGLYTYLSMCRVWRRRARVGST